MKRIAFFLVLVIASGVSLEAQGMRYPDVDRGSRAPDFSLPYATRDSLAFEELSLSSFAGVRNVILAFYPADWSGGCTREVCAFRDNFDTLQSLDAEILAISGDYPYSHHEWAKHHNLPFKLLSDHMHTVAASYHSYNRSTGYNKRTVYLVDMEGNIAYRDLEYSTKDLTSFEKLRDALNDLKQSD
jgi:peroxiredoxin